jgi:CHAT domain-containing protein/tetratricopeptide (TPR) repeat protein
MATFHRCLCVILTLWMVSSRPSASILPGASASGAWWGTLESKKIAKQADGARRAGDLTAAEAYYKLGYDDAVRRGDERAMVGYLSGIAASRLTQLRYRAALETLLEAKSHAKSIGDKAALGAIAVNLSSLHLQVWDFDSAMREAQEGLDAVSSLRKPYFLPNLLIQLGCLHDIQRDSSAVSFYRRGIEAARMSGDKQLEALGLDLLGEERLGQHDLANAEKAIEEGMRLREKFSPAELDLSWWRMGDLKRLQGDLPAAARFTDIALKAKGRAPEYRLKHQRGDIRLATGDRMGALADFREAMELSSRWRLEVMPASTSLTSANELLDGYVFSSFVDAAAQEALRTGSQRWVEQGFEALELNRAASLRESLSLADAWHRKVPPQYWEALGKLRRLDAKSGDSGSRSDESRSLHLELAEMEAKAGLGFPAKNSESFHDQSSLIHFQDGLSRTEVLLSFHLGNRESYLWVVTRNTLRVQKIAAESVIRAQVLALKDAVRAGRPEAVELGERLYRELFGRLGQEATSKSSWMLSLEGTLFEAPFAALVTERKGGKVNYLVSKHSLQTIPGALLLSRHPEAGAGWFLGVGDPIYNAADPRWGEHKKPVDFLSLFQPMTAGTAVQYARLVGTADELKMSAANWNRGSTVLLEGTAARRDLFLSQLARGPSAIHIATHVISPPGKQAFIVFGLGQNGESEALTTADIASLRVPGAFVAMTGCDTGSGEVRAGAGLLGLTRAWQMAGAAAVLATSWNVRDSSGDVLASFYKHLRDVPAAEALRLSQMEMLNSGTWRAMPSYWASYQITGGAR